MGAKIKNMKEEIELREEIKRLREELVILEARLEKYHKAYWAVRDECARLAGHARKKKTSEKYYSLIKMGDDIRNG